MRRSWLLCLLLAFPSVAGAQPSRVYIANDDHTDYFWSGTDVAYRQAFLDMLDYYLDQVDATAGDPSDVQGRFACDGSLWLWEYERNRSAAQFQRLLDRIRDGHISAPMTPLVILWGGAPAEAVLRGMYYAGRLERRHDLRFRLAVSMENQTLPWGLASLWAGAGARYSWRGICACASRVPTAGDRDQEIYWYTGPDGGRILMKWNSVLTPNNTGIGSYAEARDPAAAVTFLSSDPDYLSRYPYSVAGAFGFGWDLFQSQTDAFPTTAVAMSDASRRVIVSNEEDFFLDFEATHGDGLAAESWSYGNEWELYAASLAEVSAGVKRAVERLRGAEAMAAVAALHDPALLPGREGARDLAFMNLGLYWEHDWTADGGVARPVREAWQRRLLAEIQAYVDPLHDDAAASLGTRIPAAPAGTRFFAFNPLGWARTDRVDLPWAGATAIHVVEVESGLEAPSQIVDLPEGRFLRVLARDIPALGYRTFDVLDGPPQALGDAATVTGDVLESSAYAVTLAGRGAIVSLVDRLRENRQLAAEVDGLAMNDLGPGAGALEVENAGPVSVTLKATAATPLAHTTRVTLIRDVDRVEIRNDVTENFGDVRSWGFGFALSPFLLRHEEVGAIVRARRVAAGGDYADRNARLDWLTLNHFADVSAPGGQGFTLSNADALFFRLGNSTATTLDTTTPRLSVLLGGQVDGTALGIQNQGGDTQFRQRFAVQGHDAYDPAAAMRMSLEHQNPLVAGLATGELPVLPGDRYSALSLAGDGVLLWALKPAEEGIEDGLIARLWNVADEPGVASMQTLPDPLGAAVAATHLETDEAPLPVTTDGLTLSFARQQMRTVRLLPVSLGGPVDADGDGRGSRVDCADGDPGAWTPPGEATGLTLGRDPVAPQTTHLGWMPPADAGGTFLAHDLLRSTDPGDFVDGVACVEWDDALDTFGHDGALPAPGGVFHYLVRPENGCSGSAGSLGYSSAGIPRTAGPCPSTTFDGDGDGAVQADDCDDGNPAAWRLPGEAQALLLDHDTGTGVTGLRWSPPADGGADAVRYDVLRSDLPGDFGGATCVESGDRSDTAAQDTVAPPAASAAGFLVRAVNDCPDGRGPLGTGSGGAPRTGPVCP